MIIHGYIPGWSHAEGMTSYLKANNICIFDYSSFFQPFTEQVRQNAQRIADENGIEKSPELLQIRLLNQTENPGMEDMIFV